MRVRLLGPVEVSAGGREPDGRPVTGLRRRAALSGLALHPGRVVAADQLVDIVWGESVPPTAATTLPSHISHLRRLLGDRYGIVARPPGYLLNLGPDATDVQVAERLITQGLRQAGLDERIHFLRTAVAMWRGPALADLSALAWFAPRRRHLADLYLQAGHALAEARLARGEHAQLIPELDCRCQESPYDERAYAQLMLALYRAGRQADALAVYQRLRRALREELGVDPTEAVRDLETAILRQDERLDLAQVSGR